MKYASLHIIFICLISSFGLVAQTHLNNFHHLSVEDGLPSDLVYDVLQDRKGFMWFATGSGLCRYDGYTFKNFTVSDGIAKNDIRRIFLDSKDKIWILPMGTVTIRNEDGFTIQNKTQYLGDDRKLSILEDSLGQVWLSSRNLTYISPDADIEPEKLQSRKIGIRSTPILEFVDRNNNLWISSREGLTVVKDQNLVRKIAPNFPSTDPLFQFVSCYLSDDKILHNTSDGIILMDTLGNTQLAYEHKGGDFDINQTSFIHEDGKGGIWVAGKNSGVLRLERMGNKLVLRDHALKGISITRIFEDLEGNLWFVTYGNGVYLLNSNAASITLRSTDIVQQLFSQQPTLESQIVSMETDSENRLWMADPLGKIKIITRKTPTEWTSESLDLSKFWKKDTRLIQILSLKDLKMLVATTTGLCIYKEGIYTQLHGIKEPTSLHRSKSGEIVIGTKDNYDYILSEKDVLGLQDNTELNSRFKSWLAQGKRHFGAATNMKHKDQQGDIWTAFSGGLHRDSVIDKRHFKDEPVFSARVEDMADSRDGLLWIATNGSGLILVKGNLFQEINTEYKGMNSNVCKDILVDDQAGNIWIATNRGIGKISRYDFEEKYFPIQWFTEKEGLISNNTQNLYKYQGDIYVATDKGITLFDENKIQEDNFLPKIYITEVRADDKSQDKASSYSFPYNKNSIEIFFTGISYRNLGHLQFQYKLEEIDEEWKTTTETSIRYSSLEAGSYTFLVKAASTNGPVSPIPAKVKFEIDPIFYKTSWFIGLIFLAGILLVYGLLKYMYTARQRLELERRVDEKTYQLNQKVDELRRTNKDLEQFAYVASHDLKTPLRTVIGHLQLLERKYRGKLDKDAEDYIVFAVEGSKKMYGMINDLLSYAKVGREQISFESVDLNRVLASVERSLDSIIKEKNAVIHYENLPTFMGVNTLWEQLFQNLINNGLKFNLSEQPEIRILYKDSPDYWIISVADNGIGIEEEYQARIFELFQRLHTTEFPGTGIGLAVCKRIVELHNGSIWVESESGKGTVFFFTIEKKSKS